MFYHVTLCCSRSIGDVELECKNLTVYKGNGEGGQWPVCTDDVYKPKPDSCIIYSFRYVLLRYYL